MLEFLLSIGGVLLAWLAFWAFLEDQGGAACGFGLATLFYVVMAYRVVHGLA
jgi:hypothetical protein